MRAGVAADGEACVVTSRAEWNVIVLGMPRPDFRQSWQWGGLRASRGWTVLRVAVGRDEHCAAAAQVIGQRVPGLGVVLHAPRGPAPGRGRARGARAATPPTSAEGRDRRDLPARQPGGRRRGRCDLWSLWNAPRNVMRLDLSGSESALLGRMSRRRRQHVSTGARKGATAEVMTSLAALRTFHELHVAHGRREGYPVPPWPALEVLHREFAVEDGLAVFVGRVRGELASMLVGLRFGPVAPTLYAASRALARTAPVGWELMRWVPEGATPVPRAS
jgi:peptidoglycan pentaglycine glycine transferase (the first glycine)